MFDDQDVNVKFFSTYNINKDFALYANLCNIWVSLANFVVSHCKAIIIISKSLEITSIKLYDSLQRILFDL